MKQTSLVYILLFSIFIIPGVGTSIAAPSQKPLPPLQVSIAPSQDELTPDKIKPGDVIEFQIRAASMLDSQEVTIAVELAGGAELVSGNLSWTGSMKRREVKTVVLTVRAPSSGLGRIKASAVLTMKDGPVMSTGAYYTLGVDKTANKMLNGSLKKDGKGRDIQEYR